MVNIYVCMCVLGVASSSKERGRDCGSVQGQKGNCEICNVGQWEWEKGRAGKG